MSSTLPTISQALGDVRGKTVLVRSDLNVPLAGPPGDRVITDDGATGVI